MAYILNRRVFFKVAATGVSGCMISPVELFSQGTLPAVNILGTARYCIFVLLGGAPSQVDTFDLKVGPWTPESFVPSTVQGLDWPSGILPNLGSQLSKNRLSVVRSCQAPALVHTLQQTWTQTGRSPANAIGQIAPNMGSIVALETERERQANQPVPGFLTLNSGNVVAGPGYLPGRYSAFNGTPVGGNGLPNLVHIGGGASFEATFNARYEMLRRLDESLRGNSSVSPKLEEMSDFYASARELMRDGRVHAAFLPAQDDSRRYGTGTSSTPFGNACVTAKNVLQADLGVRFIQLNLGGWDHHGDIHNPATGMTPLARQLDSGLGNLIEDLSQMPGSRGTLLDDTLIIARGEFGRTIGPLNAIAGRDHYFTYSALVAGGGTRGGRALGSTTPDGAFVDDPGWSQRRPVYSEDFVATIYSAMGINYRTTRRDDPLGLGFEYVASANTAYIGEPIIELFR